MSDFNSRQLGFIREHCRWVLDKKSFNVREVAENLSISTRTVYNRMNSGKLGNFYIGEKIRRISALSIVKHLTQQGTKGISRR